MVAVVILAVLVLVVAQAPASDARLAPPAALTEAGHSRVAPVPAAPCPPPESALRERDLTVPYPERLYLLADGSLCRPNVAMRGVDAR